MVVVSVTRLKIRSPLFLIPFMISAIQSSQQAKRAAGNLSAATRKDQGLVFWTLTTWDSEASMRHYIRAGSHGKAMAKLAEWCDEASLVHWLQEPDQPVNWQIASERMLKEAHFSRVKYPSVDHQQRRIPTPQF
ncbi:MAG: hypothetical protein NW237_14650 [Cyanobacteriota bacterium]|nr:hypothetical protein [Cyanobacteriota bacterium]